MWRSNVNTGVFRLHAIAIFLFALCTGVLWQCRAYDQAEPRVSYWLWAGLTTHDAPPNSELYVYQGLIRTDTLNSVYERRGLFPHPLKCKMLYLVYRLEGPLPDSKAIVDEFEQAVARWQRHPVVVAGIQLDFDSPTAKLSTYSAFLREFRNQLAPQFELSITGLGDWVMSGDQGAMELITSTVDEMVIQLYRGRRPLANIDDYLYALSRYPLPFRIGLISVAEPPEYLEELEKNPNFNGIIYFVLGGI